MFYQSGFYNIYPTPGAVPTAHKTEGRCYYNYSPLNIKYFTYSSCSALIMAPLLQSCGTYQ